jgi:hypothetical protein
MARWLEIEPTACSELVTAGAFIELLSARHETAALQTMDSRDWLDSCISVGSGGGGNCGWLLRRRPCLPRRQRASALRPLVSPRVGATHMRLFLVAEGHL